MRLSILQCCNAAGFPDRDLSILQSCIAAMLLTSRQRPVHFAKPHCCNAADFPDTHSPNFAMLQCC